MIIHSQDVFSVSSRRTTYTTMASINLIYNKYNTFKVFTLINLIDSFSKDQTLSMLGVSTLMTIRLTILLIWANQIVLFFVDNLMSFSNIPWIEIFRTYVQKLLCYFVIVNYSMMSILYYDLTIIHFVIAYAYELIVNITQKW